MSYLDYLLTDEVFDGKKHFREINWIKTLLLAGVILLIDWVTMASGPPRMDINVADTVISLAVAMLPIAIMIGLWHGVSRSSF